MEVELSRLRSQTHDAINIAREFALFIAGSFGAGRDGTSGSGA